MFYQLQKGVCIVENMDLATKFLSYDKAVDELHRCSKKLKGYYVFDLKTENIIQKFAKVKRKSFTNIQRRAIYNRNKGRCAICGDFVPYGEFTIDHITPLAKGGTNDLENLQCACKVCNIIKQDILPEELMERLNKIVLYQMSKNYNSNLFEEINELRKERQRRRIRCCIRKIKKIGERIYERQN